MAKNLTEVIENVKMDEQKEFYVVTTHKGKIYVFISTFIFNFIAISCLLLSQKSRYAKSY